MAKVGGMTRGFARVVGMSRGLHGEGGWYD